MIHVVDTHALTRYVEDYGKLGAAGRAIFDDPESILIVPTIALAEARFMIFKNKVQLVWAQITDTIERDHRLIPVPLTLDILNRVPDGLEMHDGIIVATAIAFRNSMGEEVSPDHSRQGHPRLRSRRDRLVAVSTPHLVYSTSVEHIDSREETHHG